MLKSSLIAVSLLLTLSACEGKKSNKRHTHPATTDEVSQGNQDEGSKGEEATLVAKEVPVVENPVVIPEVTPVPDVNPIDPEPELKKKEGEESPELKQTQQTQQAQQADATACAADQEGAMHCLAAAQQQAL